MYLLPIGMDRVANRHPKIMKVKGTEGKVNMSEEAITYTDSLPAILELFNSKDELKKIKRIFKDLGTRGVSFYLFILHKQVTCPGFKIALIDDNSRNEKIRENPRIKNLEPQVMQEFNGLWKQFYSDTVLPQILKYL